MPLLQSQQCCLRLKPSSETGKRSSTADDAVTGNDDRQGIAPIGCTNCTTGQRPADLFRHFTITARLSIGNCLQCLPDLPLKPGSLRRKCQFEAGQFTAEISQQLAPCFGKGAVIRPPHILVTHA